MEGLSWSMIIRTEAGDRRADCLMPDASLGQRLARHIGASAPSNIPRLIKTTSSISCNTGWPQTRSSRLTASESSVARNNQPRIWEKSLFAAANRFI